MLLLITKPSFIRRTGLIEEIKQIILFMHSIYTLGIYKGLFASSTPSCYDIKDDDDVIWTSIWNFVSNGKLDIGLA